MFSRRRATAPIDISISFTGQYESLALDLRSSAPR
jgi:hypothetical protein